MAWVRNLVFSSLIGASPTLHKNKVKKQMQFFKKENAKHWGWEYPCMCSSQMFQQQKSHPLSQKKLPLFPNLSALCKCVGQKPQRPRAKL
jgi:hypothetical protein